MQSVVVGGDGWVAQTAIAQLTRNTSVPAEEITVYGSKERDSTPIEGRVFPIQKWEPIKEKFEVGTFIPAAFITLDKFNEFGEQKFISLNRNLIGRAVNYIRVNSPGRCILLSSGVVSIPRINLGESRPRSIYQGLKLEEEESIKLACEISGTSLVICRLFNASGRYTGRIKHYALPSLIFQALTENKVSIRNESLVWRRYANLTQVLDVSLELAKVHKFICFESGGILVELRELAKEIASCIGVKYVDSPNSSDFNDRYYSKKFEFEELLSRFGQEPLSLTEQINETLGGVQESLSLKNSDT